MCCGGGLPHHKQVRCSWGGAVPSSSDCATPAQRGRVAVRDACLALVGPYQQMGKCWGSWGLKAHRSSRARTWAGALRTAHWLSPSAWAATGAPHNSPYSSTLAGRSLPLPFSPQLRALPLSCQSLSTAADSLAHQTPLCDRCRGCCCCCPRDNLRGFFEYCFPLLLKKVFGYDDSEVSWLHTAGRVSGVVVSGAAVGVD